MVKVTRYIYLIFAILFVVGVLVQVYLAGMVVVATRSGWGNHIGLGHTLAGPLVFMLITQYLGKLPRSTKSLTWILFGVYVLQADILIFLRTTAPVLSALHPVLALIDFAIGYALMVRAWKLVRAPEMAEMTTEPSATPASSLE